jgi:peptidase E
MAEPTAEPTDGPTDGPSRDTVTSTILATSGGMRRGARSALGFGPLISYALELSGAAGRPRLCYLGTAGGDQRYVTAQVAEAGAAAGVSVEPLHLFPMPSVADPAEYLRGFDVIWVGGGSVANLLALWRIHQLDRALEQAWRAGVVLSGVSAGSICWHLGGTTDSFGHDLVAVHNGLGFLPYSNGVHYDSEAQRRPLFQRLIAAGELPEGYATDDGVGLLYRGTELVEVVSETRGKAGYHVRAEDGRAIEERLEPRLLPGS